MFVVFLGRLFVVVDLVCYPLLLFVLHLFALLLSLLPSLRPYLLLALLAFVLVLVFVLLVLLEEEEGEGRAKKGLRRLLHQRAF